MKRKFFTKITMIITLTALTQLHAMNTHQPRWPQTNTAPLTFDEMYHNNTQMTQQLVQLGAGACPHQM